MAYDDYEYEEYSSAGDKSLKGYKTVIVLLAIVLVAVSGLYFFQSARIKAEFAIERDTLTNRILAVNNSLGLIRTENDSLNQSIILERMRVDSVLEVMARERNVTRSKLRSYERELSTMRAAAQGFVYTIDSLSKVNSRLIDENLGMRREITSERLRADKAEERATDLGVTVRQASRVMARDIRLVLLNSADREVTRVGRARRVRTDFVLSANAVADPGARSVYVRIVGPDGYVMPSGGGQTFAFEGQQVVYSTMREVDYSGDDLPVAVYYTPGELLIGTYTVEVYMDGLLAGSSETILR